MQRRRLPFGFYVSIVFVVIFAGIAFFARLDTGNWGMGVGILCMIVMVLIMGAVFSAYYAIEGAYYRWKRRRQQAKDLTP
jgi:hypothetical protein